MISLKLTIKFKVFAAVELKMGRFYAQVLLMLVMIALPVVVRCCPRPCACQQPAEVHCTFRSLLTVPAGVPKQVERMNLGFNTIHRIAYSSFAGLRKLELLLMHGNDVHQIPDGTFRDLISLQMLKLSYNKLKVISRQTFVGLWSLTRLHLDHNRLEFIHPNAFQGLMSLRLLQLEGNQLQQLHPATFSTFSILGHFPVSTLKHLYLSDNLLTTLSQRMLAGMPYLENLSLHGNPWTCDCRMRWFKDWNKNSPGVLKCKKDKAYPDGQLCPMCFSSKHLKKKQLQELEKPTCNSPIISTAHRAISPEDTESDLLTIDEFRQPLGNISLGLSDEHGHQVDLECLVTEPRELTSIGWDYVNQYQISANVTLTLDLKCATDRSSYERLWRLIAYYSDVPAHLRREIMLSKEAYTSFRYRQDVERDALYYTGVKANIAADPPWIMQSSMDLQLNRLQSTSKTVRLILSTHMTEVMEKESIREQSRGWVVIESKNDTRTMQAAVVRSPAEINCSIQSSGNESVKWMLPDGSTLKTPYSDGDNRLSASNAGLLKIKSVDHSDSGVYYCIAQVSDDLTILPFRLTVEESSSPPPGGEGVTEPVTGFTGGPFFLPCVATGSPDAEIHWILPDGSIINKWVNISRIFVASNGSLIIRHSQLSDNGYYKCVAGNQHGMDTLARKVIISRPPGLLPLRKYSSSPQPAEGVSTQVLVTNDMESSGDNEPEEFLEKVLPRQVDLPNRRRVPSVGIRRGHPFRNSWRRPATPRRRVGSPVVDRVNTVESRRNISVSNNQIDPKRWASILAKVRSGGTSLKTTTPNYVQTSSNKIQESETAYTKQSEIANKIEGSSAEDTTIEGTRAPVKDALYSVTMSQMPTESTEYNLDIRALDSEDSRHVVYQIAAPETDPNSDLFTVSTYITQPTVGPQMTHFTLGDSEVAEGVAVSTVWSTASYGTHLQENQSHTMDGGRVTEAIQKSDGEDDEERRVLQNPELVGEVYQGRMDHSLASTTAKTFTEPNTETAVYSFTEILTTIKQGPQTLRKHITQKKHNVSKIPLLLTVTPTTKPTSGHKATFTNSFNASSSHARNSSSLRRRNGGRGRKSNRIRSKTNSSKSSVYVTNVTPQPTSASIVEVTNWFSVITKTTASSQTKIETSSWAKSAGAKMNITVPLTDSQPPSLGKMTHEENTDPLYSGRNNKIHTSTSQENVSMTKDRHSSDSKPAQELKNTAIVPVSPSIFSNFGREQEKATIQKENKSNLSPHITNPPVKADIHEWFTSIHTPAAKKFEETQQGKITREPSSIPTSDSSHAQLEELPGASPDKTNNQYNPTETENILSYKELEGRFSVRQFTSSSPNIQKEFLKNNLEIQHGSAPAATTIFEGAQQSSRVPTGSPKISPVLVLATTNPSRLPTGSIHNREDSSLSMNPWAPSENADLPPVTKENIIATTTTTALKSSTVHTHMFYPNTPTSASMLGELDNANHIPDSDKYIFVTTGKEIISKIELSRTNSRAGPPVTVPYQLASVSEETVSQELEVDIHKKTTTKTATTQPLHSTSTVSSPKQKPPGRPGVQGRGSSLIHYATSGGPQQRPTAVPEGSGKPWIISTDIISVTAHAETDAYLPCVAVGKPSPFISWTKVSTGASVTQNTRVQRFEVSSNGTLIIHNVLPLDQGQYLCSAQNQYGEDKIVVNLIVLAEHPRVLQPRYSEVTAYLGETVQFECQSQAHPQPRITWVLPDRGMVHSSGPTHANPENNVSVLPNGTLHMKSVSHMYRGIYKCIASNAAGADTISVRLTIAALPPIIQQPRHENVTLPEGSTTYLNCTARGAPPPSIGWITPGGMQLHPSQFINGRNLFVFPNGTLYVHSLFLTDAGRYECSVTNVVGTARRTIILTVGKSIIYSRAKITFSSPQKTDVVYGSRLHLDCIASGNPEPRIIWRTPSKKLVDAHYSYDQRIKVSANGTLSIVSVTEKDDGEYLCVVRNKFGDDFVPFKVIVLAKPAKIEQKTESDKKVMYGGNLKVDCVASGLPDPKIQWALPDGTMINSVMKSERNVGSRSRRYVVFDNGTLFFNEVGMREEGHYTCYAENQVGKDEMKVHVKVVADVPVIANKTNDVIRVLYGESISLQCSAKGEPTPLILWFSPTNRAITSGSDKYFIHDNGTLVIQKVQRFDGGNYICLARNSAGQDRKVTRVEILVSPPAINGLIGTTNSMRVSSVGDQRKLIDCETTGTPVPRVMWVLPENVVLPAPYYGSRLTVHRNGTLDIRSVRMTDAGQLACVARNEGGETRLVVQLGVTDILEKPKLKSPKMESLLLTVGRTINLNCSIDGSPTPQLTWILLNGSPLQSGAQFSKFLHKSDGTLVISNPALSEAGTYRCLGRNAAGMVERTVTLMPGHKPEINNRYNSPVSIMNGQSLHLHCLTNTDSVRLAWTLPSGMVLNRPQRAGRYAVLPNGTLSIQQASVHDRGSYTCRASNEYGSSLLTAPVIIIAYPPRITSGPAPATNAKRGVAVQLNCGAMSIPKAEVAWETPDRTRLIVSPQPRLIGNKYLHPQGSLIIQNPTIRDTGLYRCTARNVVGVDTKSTYLYVY
ncbi:matrix-remodeling-associated protein 5-like [Sinocyclocheilus anshuiensis]|uniref:matrix-remodeling-associated protein 5-like n=1 Tax=Sinocyclocheilus anshuiensis TaxID=1608454 RepID=UPI0007B7C045|nr:PREDICTED: matrix-remodeling-associated protein 5-like [Sinocyclocheilus anshuiensis]